MGLSAAVGVVCLDKAKARLQDKHWLDEKAHHVLGGSLGRGLGLSSSHFLGWFQVLGQMEALPSPPQHS